MFSAGPISARVSSALKKPTREQQAHSSPRNCSVCSIGRAGKEKGSRSRPGKRPCEQTIPHVLHSRVLRRVHLSRTSNSSSFAFLPIDTLVVASPGMRRVREKRRESRRKQISPDETDGGITFGQQHNVYTVYSRIFGYTRGGQVNHTSAFPGLIL